MNKQRQYVVICNNDDGRSIVLITSSKNKADKLADKLQEKYNPDLTNENSNGVLFEVEMYRGFDKELWLREDKSE